MYTDRFPWNFKCIPWHFPCILIKNLLKFASEGDADKKQNKTKQKTTYDEECSTNLLMAYIYDIIWRQEDTLIKSLAQLSLMLYNVHRN